MRKKAKSDIPLTVRKVLQIGVVALIVLGAAGYAGHRWLQSWRYDKAIRDTEDFLRLGDPRSAAFAAKRAAHLRDDSVPAARMLAEALEKTDSVEAVVWRKKVVELAPGDWRDHIAFATAAMKFRDPQLASVALEKVDATGRQHIDFHRTAADIALALGNNVDAETHLTEIVRLDPYDSTRRMQLAMIGLASPDTAKAVLARTQLEDLKDDPQLRLGVLRLLVRESTRANAKPSLRLTLSAGSSLTESPLTHDPRLGGLALELLAEPETTVDDCLVGLEVLRLMRHPDFREKLPRLETAKFDKAADIGDAMLWLNGRGLGARALEWSERMPAELRAAPEVLLATADARMLLKDWTAAQTVVAEGEWGEFEGDRLVIGAIAWRELKDPHRADASWNLAELSFRGKLARIERLAQLCARWGAEPEREKLWWAQADCPGDQNEVLKKLFTAALKRKDSTALYRAVKGMHLLKREEPAAMNNYAWLSLLRNEDLENAHQLAERAFASNPTVGAYASTYAYSLHLRGRTAEGLKVLETVPRATLNDPTVAGCYGFLLDAAGEKEKALDYLGIARRSPDLLPEEMQLFLEKRERLDRSLEVPDLRIFSTEA